MRYPYHSQSRIRLGRAIAFAVLVFAVICLSGCGVVGNSVNAVRAVQLPPGKLYDHEFYAKATPEEVKKAIGGKNLAEESYTERYYASNTKGRGFLADLEEKVNNVVTVFYPLSSVKSRAPEYPLQTAIWSTPHPEVITMMLDAGAEIERVNVPYHVASTVARPEISKVLIARSSAEGQCRSLIAAAGAGKKDLIEYCLDTMAVSPSCVADKSYPLREALRAKRLETVKYLVSRGAVLPESADERLELLGIALRGKSPESFNWLIGMGVDCSLTGSGGKNDLMRAASSGDFTDEAALAYLAGKVPVDTANVGAALYYAYGMKNKEPLEVLLKRVKRLPPKDAEVLKVLEKVIRKGDADMFWRLVAKGADCSAVNKYGENELMEIAARSLPNDAKIATYLVRHSPWRETGVRVSFPRD